MGSNFSTEDGSGQRPAPRWRSCDSIHEDSTVPIGEEHLDGDLVPASAPKMVAD